MARAVASTPEGSATLRRSILAHRNRIAAAAALFVCHQSGEALVPVLVGVIIDRATATGELSTLLLWLAVLAGNFLVLSLTWRLGMRVALLAGVRADRTLRLGVTARVLDSRGMVRSDLLPGALVSIATADVRRTTMLNFHLPHGVAAVVGTAVASIALLVVSIPLGLLILLGAPLLLLVVRWLSNPLESRAAAQQESAARAAGVAVDLVRGVRVLKGIGAEAAGLARYRAISRESLAATLRSTRAEAGQSGAVAAVNGLFLALVALVGGRLAVAGNITAGELVSAVGLAAFLQGPLGTFGDITAAFAAGRASAGRIAGVLTDPAATPGGRGAPGPAVAGEIVVSGVSGGGLFGVEFTVAAGELVCLVITDPTAAAMLLRYLGRDADPPDGRILLDGVALSTLAPDKLRSAVLVSPHDPSLFEGSLRDNILAGRAGDLIPAVRAARADQVASVLPAGMATAVSERGRSLSGGQRQRVALARALHADPPVLVLHEPTTAVDTVTETEIGAGLRALRAGRTTLIVTSSPALLAIADRVVLISEGRVTAAGHHDVLSRDNSAYRELVLT
ncbi:ABC transporter ATP-binding protein [Frankia gtarii]|uniref:ABC transporter ATP-binding protein n=1 Tax=Frankia gtarii TaxID=2950102 RepID=UPI0021BF8312|nr:ABC transporter ATP-binding protein [Frankia gtarii]